MKIEIDVKPTREYLDEFLYVVNYNKRVKKNPHKKVHRMTRFLLGFEVFVIIYVAFMYFVCKNSFTTFALAAFIALIITGLTVALMLAKVTVGLNTLMKNTGKKTVEITKDEVIYTDENKSVTIKWDNVKYVVINKYSIAFLTNDATNIIISTIIDYKDQVLQGIEEAGHTDLVVDNSSKY